MILIMIRTKNEPSEILVRGGGEQSRLPFFNQKYPLWVTKVNAKARLDLCDCTGSSYNTHQGQRFPTIPKLNKMGARPSIIPWICSSFLQRSQFVRYQNSNSLLLNLSGGISLGTLTVTGPATFVAQSQCLCFY